MKNKIQTLEENQQRFKMLAKQVITYFFQCNVMFLFAPPKFVVNSEPAVSKLIIIMVYKYYNLQLISIAFYDCMNTSACF